jgi:hypothetical protein
MGQVGVEANPTSRIKEAGPGVKAISVASDPTNGPLLGVLDSSGTFYAKEGGLSSTWIAEDGPGVKAISVASDPTNGPQLGVIDSSGTIYAKQGALGATWIGETGGNAQAVALPGTAGAVPSHRLTTAVAGSGSGSVTGAGISCPGTCSASFPEGTSVTLKAMAAGGSTFAGWSGACTGTAACTLTMSAARSVQASFLRDCVVPTLKGKSLRAASRLSELTAVPSERSNGAAPTR